MSCKKTGCSLDESPGDEWDFLACLFFIVPSCICSCTPYSVASTFSPYVPGVWVLNQGPPCPMQFTLIFSLISRHPHSDGTVVILKLEIEKLRHLIFFFSGSCSESHCQYIPLSSLPGEICNPKWPMGNHRKHQTAGTQGRPFPWPVCHKGSGYRLLGAPPRRPQQHRQSCSRLSQGCLEFWIDRDAKMPFSAVACLVQVVSENHVRVKLLALKLKEFRKFIFRKKIVF